MTETKKLNEIDNCVVCKKYLKELYEQEQGMCTYCDIKTNGIANELDENSKRVEASIKMTDKEIAASLKKLW